jgi:hypothetical protein
MSVANPDHIKIDKYYSTIEADKVRDFINNSNPRNDHYGPPQDSNPII